MSQLNSIESPIYLGDFETGTLSQWEAICAQSGDRITVVNSPKRQGNYAAKFTVFDNDTCLGGGERAEVNQSCSETDGTDRYYAWSTLFPSDWKKDNVWGVIYTQFHAFNDRSPPLAFAADEFNRLVMVVCAGDVTASGDCPEYQSYIIEEVLTKGLWHDFILHVRWSRSTDGLIEVWHRLEHQTDFIRIINVSGRPTLQWKITNPPNNATITTYQMGIYRGEGNGFPTTLYHDGFRVGNSYNSVLYRAYPLCNFTYSQTE